MPVTYVATATHDASDRERTDRVARHRAGRPSDWATREVPRDLEGALTGIVEQGGSVVIDCLTLWITNLMLGLGGGPELVDEGVLDALARAAQVAKGGEARVIWVPNEFGSGVVPISAMGGRFTDLQGWANRRPA